ncbi:ChbG/HpnK family deacetylase [Pusillimonas sp. CC-YST705]|uniref:ChbG/HpnK family deacetylase n=1 Tax=Mesopusillimonas faecipullorum TaxID=2755040 RepID=A0ABS8CBW2_9BURK|nr:ChbG/HpnK family deacetylase [Mesopusillimonas faecipullorum]
MGGQQAAKHIIICADDFGMNSAVNQGVLELARLGRLNATSCLVDGPQFGADAAALRDSGLSAGLHLNFTEPYPAAALIHPLGTLIRKAYLRRLNPRLLRDQIARQFDRYEDLMQQAPDFVDGHQHVHQLPQIREALLGELARRYAAHPPWLRCTTALPVTGLPLSYRFKAAVIQTLGAGALGRLVKGRLPLSRSLTGVYDFQGGEASYARLLKAWLSQMREGDLLMCHPASHIMQGDILGEQRVAEFRVLAAPETGQHLARLGLTLTLPRRLACPYP